MATGIQTILLASEVVWDTGFSHNPVTGYGEADDPLVVNENFLTRPLGNAGIAELNAEGWSDGRGGPIDNTQYTIANVGGINVFQKLGAVNYTWFAPPGTYVNAVCRMKPRPGAAALGIAFNICVYRDDGGGGGCRQGVRWQMDQNWRWYIYGAGAGWGRVHLFAYGTGLLPDHRFLTDYTWWAGVLNETDKRVFLRVESPTLTAATFHEHEDIRQIVTDLTAGPAVFRNVLYNQNSHCEEVQVYEIRTGQHVASTTTTLPTTTGIAVRASGKTKVEVDPGTGYVFVESNDPADTVVDFPVIPYGTAMSARWTQTNEDNVTRQDVTNEVQLTGILPPAGRFSEGPIRASTKPLTTIGATIISRDLIP